MEEEKVFTNEDLERTYLRIEDAKGKWRSVSMREAVDGGMMPGLIRWFGERMVDACGLGKLPDEDAAVMMARIVESSLGPLAKLKPASE